jgi:hypothetical protein
MLFLLRPRQTWMPYQLPRPRAQQAEYNRQLDEAYASTRRVGSPAAGSAAVSHDTVTALKEVAQLHDAGKLSDEEFSAAKAKIIASDE